MMRYNGATAIKVVEKARATEGRLGLGEILLRLSGGADMRELPTGTVTLLFTDMRVHAFTPTPG